MVSRGCSPREALGRGGRGAGAPPKGFGTDLVHLGGAGAGLVKEKGGLRMKPEVDELVRLQNLVEEIRHEVNENSRKIHELDVGIAKLRGYVLELIELGRRC